MKNSLLVPLLIKKKISISTAESCTGGLLASKITEVPNSSKIFNFGLVTYSNKSKEKLLNIKKNTLQKYGAVSSQTCMEMVENLSRLSKSNICISITGVAGPGGGSKVKPVGLVYVGIKSKNKTRIYEFRLKKDLSRKKIQSSIVNKVFKLIFSSI